MTKNSMFLRVHPWLRRALICLPFAWLWFVLVNHLRVEWTLNPQYGYGWAVPFLCAYLIWGKLENRNKKAEIESWKPEAGFLNFRISAFCFLLLAFLYFPTRLVQEANPDWRLVSWALAVEVTGLSLLFLHFNASTLQRFNLSVREFIFPVCFFLVAVPWPTMIEQPLIQGLTRADAGATCELLGWLGIPAMPHG